MAERTVVFEEEYQASDVGISLHGLIDGEAVTHRVERSVLRDFCDLHPGQKREDAYDRYRRQLQEVIRRMIAHDVEPNDFGGVDVTANDIRQYGNDLEWKAGPAG